MEAAKHTPAPWVSQRCPEYPDQCTIGRRFETLEVDGAEVTHVWGFAKQADDDQFFLISGQMSPADEALIKAAPKLLDSLRECAEALEGFASRAGCQTQSAALRSDAEDFGALGALDRARAIIAQAEGRT